MRKSRGPRPETRTPAGQGQALNSVTDKENELGGYTAMSLYRQRLATILWISLNSGLRLREIVSLTARSAK